MLTFVFESAGRRLRRNRHSANRIDVFSHGHLVYFSPSAQFAFRALVRFEPADLVAFVRLVG